MHRVNVDSVQVVTGASEALLILMWMVAEPGANVILPKPGFTTFPQCLNRCGLRLVWVPEILAPEFRNPQD